MENKSLILCDTDILIEFYKGNKIVVHNLENIGQRNIAISIITAGELLYGVLSHRLALPDGMIAATAIANNIPLYTNNLKDFKYIEGLVLYKEK